MIDHKILPDRTYQRIVRNGVQLRRGSIDTHAKFEAMKGVASFERKNVLDVGCNFGEMTGLIKAAGAHYILGIDKDPENVRVARLLNPDIGFTCCTLEGAVGRHWDLIVCSAVLHYMPSLADAFRTLARLGTGVIGDVCLVPTPSTGPKEVFGLDHDRGLLYPSMEMFTALASKYWNCVHWGGLAPSPDLTMRRFFSLQDRMPVAVPAKVIWGPGGSGKTTMAKDLESGQGYRHLQTDAIFIEWRQKYPGSLSNMDFVDSVWTRSEIDYDASTAIRYLAFHLRYISRWLERHNGLPVVIEGYDICNEAYRQMVNAALWKSGYSSGTIEQIELPARAK